MFDFFEKPPYILFSTTAIPFYISTSSAQEFPFSTPMSTFAVFGLFVLLIIVILMGEVISLLWFCFAFFYWASLYILLPFISLWGSIYLSLFTHFFNSFVVCVFGVLTIFQAAAHIFSFSGSTAISPPFLLLTKLLEPVSPIRSRSVNVWR